MADLALPGLILVLHRPVLIVSTACDVMEDVAIAYGYNNLVRTVPKTTTVGRELPLNQVRLCWGGAHNSPAPGRARLWLSVKGSRQGIGDVEMAHNRRISIALCEAACCSPLVPTACCFCPHHSTPTDVRAAARRGGHGGLHRNPDLGALLASGEL